MIELFIFIIVTLLALRIIMVNNGFSFKSYFKTRKKAVKKKKPVNNTKYSFEKSIKKFGHLSYTKSEGGQFTEEVVDHLMKTLK